MNKDIDFILAYDNTIIEFKEYSLHSNSSLSPSNTNNHNFIVKNKDLLIKSPKILPEKKLFSPNKVNLNGRIPMKKW